MSRTRLRLVSVAAIAVVAALAAGCAGTPPYAGPGQAAPSSSTGAVATPAPSAESTPQAPPAPVQPPKQFRLGAAPAALVSQARAQASAGNTDLALTTVERALRIEPENPLLWTELGNVHESAGHYAQADSMGRKAVQLATGDPAAESAAWRLIAESLRARGRNPEAREADARANALVAR
jgi:Flp pilus assembly protein TadD